MHDVLVDKTEVGGSSLRPTRRIYIARTPEGTICAGTSEFSYREFKTPLEGIQVYSALYTTHGFALARRITEELKLLLENERF